VTKISEPTPESLANADKVAVFGEARRSFHASLLEKVLTADDKGVPANADKDSTASVRIARGILDRLGPETVGARLAGQTSGNKFEEVCKNFVDLTFRQLDHLRPGKWEVKLVGSRNRAEIARYEQYEHLILLELAAKKDRALAAALGSDYTITPDIVVSREPEEDAQLNDGRDLIDAKVSTRASLRKANNPAPLLHASISCKWTVRSDRVQNARAEALNLMRNRKGRLPHIVVVLGEPLPSRIAAIALGTGDIDCVYHFALYELIDAVKDYSEESYELLSMMIDGKRLKDISDLPLDLAV
jgi:hypothetical protein